MFLDRQKQTLVTHMYTTAIALLVFIASILYAAPAEAATTLLNRSDRMSSATASAIVQHHVRFTITDFSSVIGSIRIQFCSNSPILDTPCTPPAGFDASGRVVLNQTGETGFSIHGNSDTNTIVLTRTPSIPLTGNVSYEFGSIQNPNSPGTFYARISTYASTDATGLSIQEGGIALSVNRQFLVASEVPPFLRFCVGITLTGFDCSSASSFLIDMGEFSTSQTKFGKSEMVAVTNAASGLSISMGGTTLTSGNNTISPLFPGAGSIAGVSQFGINLRANSSPSVGADPTGPGVAVPAAAYNVPNQYRFQPGDIVASSTSPNDYRKFTVSYIANIDSSQKPGVYATTISFICLANF